MATTNKLKKYVTYIADAIRAKEGSTESSNPQDFAYRIENLSGGGGTSEGSIEYLDVSGISTITLAQILQGSIDIRMELEGSKVIYPVGAVYANDMQNKATVQAISIEFSRRIYDGTFVVTFGEYLLNFMSQADIDSIPRITKEQFYTLE